MFVLVHRFVLVCVGDQFRKVTPRDGRNRRHLVTVFGGEDEIVPRVMRLFRICSMEKAIGWSTWACSGWATLGSIEGVVSPVSGFDPEVLAMLTGHLAPDFRTLWHLKLEPPRHHHPFAGHGNETLEGGGKEGHNVLHGVIAGIPSGRGGNQ